MKAKKSLGQNFISDPGLISRIADASGVGPEDTVVEIGPGRGALTFELADRAKRVVAVELDKDLIPGLRAQALLAGNVEIINEDILQFDFAPVLRSLSEDQASAPGAARIEGSASGSPKLRIVGNLPYYITTPIIMGLLEKGVPAASLTFMVQKEVAERIVSPPGSKNYGVLSISVQYYCDVQYMLDAPAEYFSPRPKVDSAVVNLLPRSRSCRLLYVGPEDPADQTSAIDMPANADGSETGTAAKTEELEKQFFSFVKTAFVQRRKTLLNCLTGCRGLTKDQVAEILNSCAIDPVRRPETLSIEEFAAVFAKILSN